MYPVLSSGRNSFTFFELHFADFPLLQTTEIPSRNRSPFLYVFLFFFSIRAKGAKRSRPGPKKNYVKLSAGPALAFVHTVVVINRATRDDGGQRIPPDFAVDDCLHDFCCLQLWHFHPGKGVRDDRGDLDGGVGGGGRRPGRDGVHDRGGARSSDHRQF